MKPKHLLLMLLINLLWGANFIAAKWAVVEFPPVFAASIRFLIVFLLLLPFLKIVKGKMKPLLETAITLSAFHFGLLFFAIALTDEMSVIVIGTLINVPFATLLAVMFLGEKLGWRRILGLFFAFAGLFVLVFDPRAFMFLDALMLVVLSALAYAVGTIFMRRLSGIHPMTLQAWVGVIGFPTLLILSLYFEEGHLAALEGASLKAYGSIVYSAIAASIIGHGGIYYLLQKYPITIIAPQTLMAQVFAIIFGILILGDVLTLEMAIGGALTFLGVIIITLRSKREPKVIEKI